MHSHFCALSSERRSIHEVSSPCNCHINRGSLGVWLIISPSLRMMNIRGGLLGVSGICFAHGSAYSHVAAITTQSETIAQIRVTMTTVEGDISTISIFWLFESVHLRM